MASGFPCPNKSCNYSFQIEAMQGVQSITCPNCKKTFATRKPNKSGPASPSKVPKVSPPNIVNVVEDNQGLVFESKSEIKPSFTPEKKTPSKKKKSNGLTISQVFLLGFVVFFISVSFAAFYIIGLPLLKKEIRNESNQQSEGISELIDSDVLNRFDQ